MDGLTFDQGYVVEPVTGKRTLTWFHDRRGVENLFRVLKGMFRNQNSVLPFFKILMKVVRSYRPSAIAIPDCDDRFRLGGMRKIHEISTHLLYYSRYADAQGTAVVTQFEDHAVCTFGGGRMLQWFYLDKSLVFVSSGDTFERLAPSFRSNDLRYWTFRAVSGDRFRGLYFPVEKRAYERWAYFTYEFHYLSNRILLQEGLKWVTDMRATISVCKRNAHVCAVGAMYLAAVSLRYFDDDAFYRKTVKIRRADWAQAVASAEQTDFINFVGAVTRMYGYLGYTWEGNKITVPFRVMYGVGDEGCDSAIVVPSKYTGDDALDATMFFRVDVISDGFMVTREGELDPIDP